MLSKSSISSFLPLIVPSVSGVRCNMSPPQTRDWPLFSSILCCNWNATFDDVSYTILPVDKLYVVF